MAEQPGGKRRKAISGFIEDVVDDTRERLGDDEWARELNRLNAALDDLTAKVNRLAALATPARRPSS